MADNSDANHGCFAMSLRHVKLSFKSSRPPKKSQAEYQAEYRARQKADPKLWEAYQLKQKDYHQCYLSNLSDAKKEMLKAERNKRRKEARLLKKQATESSLELPTPASQSAKKKTRKRINDERIYWKEKKREQRAAMTPEQKALANHTEKERKRRKREQQRLKEAATPVPISNPVPPNPVTPNPVPPNPVTPNPVPPNPVTPNPVPPNPVTLNPVPPNPVTPNLVPPNTPSPTKNSKYSSLYRVKKVFPKSRKKELYVLKKLFLKASPFVKKELLNLMTDDSPLSGRKTKSNRNRLQSETKRQVVSFYEDHAVNVPDMKFYSKRLKRQRKVLTKPIRLIFEDFKTAFPTVKVSLRNFYRSRPAHILTMKSLKFVQCLCEQCENMRLKFQVLKKAGSRFSSITDAVNATLCSFEGEWASLECVERKCKNCGVHSLRSILRAECELTESVTYESWDAVTDSRCKGKKTQLVKYKSSVSSLIDVFCTGMHNFASHKFVDKWQRHQFNSLKSNLPSDCALIVLDFAENYSCAYQNQAQSAYYSLNQVTLHPVVVYTKCHCQKLVTDYKVFISDDLKHDSNFANYVLTYTLEHLKSLGLSKFVVFSDNCGVQYKSRLPLYHLSQFGQDFDVERCFFGERHGKSECDSLGGVVKSFLKQSVITGNAILSNATEIVTFLSNNFELHNVDCSHNNRSFHFVDSKSIDRSVTSKDVSEFKGIKKVHTFKFDGTLLSTRQLSCFCSPCMSGNYSECLSVVTSKVVTVQWPQNKKKAKERAPKKLKNAKTNRRKKTTEVQLNGNDCGVDITDSHDLDTAFLVEDVVPGAEDSHVLDTAFLVEDVVPGAEDSHVLDTGFLLEDVPGADTSQVTNCVEDVAKEFSDDVHYIVDHCIPKKLVVRRELFISGSSNDTQGVFKMFYKDLSQCTSFEEMEVLCKNVEFESLVINPKYSKPNIDKNAMSLLPPNAPRGFLPSLTVSDGNCVARSLSNLIYGDEKHHLEIRCRIIKELIDNIHLYLDEDYLTQGSNLKKDTIISKLVALSDSLKNIDLTSANYSVSVLKSEIFDTRLCGIHLGPWHLHAAAEILGCGIVSLYPSLGQPEYSEALNRAFVPSVFRSESQDPLYLLWTSNRRDMGKEHWVANHVVPMVKIHK